MNNIVNNLEKFLNKVDETINFISGPLLDLSVISVISDEDITRLMLGISMESLISNPSLISSAILSGNSGGNSKKIKKEYLDRANKLRTIIGDGYRVLKIIKNNAVLLDYDISMILKFLGYMEFIGNDLDNFLILSNKIQAGGNIDVLIAFTDSIYISALESNIDKIIDCYRISHEVIIDTKNALLTFNKEKQDEEKKRVEAENVENFKTLLIYIKNYLAKKQNINIDVISYSYDSNLTYNKNVERLIKQLIDMICTYYNETNVSVIIDSSRINNSSRRNDGYYIIEIIQAVIQKINDNRAERKKQQDKKDNIEKYLNLIVQNCPNYYKINCNYLSDILNVCDNLKNFYDESKKYEEQLLLINKKLSLLSSSVLLDNVLVSYQRFTTIDDINNIFKVEVKKQILAIISGYFDGTDLLELIISGFYLEDLTSTSIDNFISKVNEITMKVITDNMEIILGELLGISPSILSDKEFLELKNIILVWADDIRKGEYKITKLIFDYLDDSTNYHIYANVITNIDSCNIEKFKNALEQLFNGINDNDRGKQLLNYLLNYIKMQPDTVIKAQMLNYLKSYSLENSENVVQTNTNEDRIANGFNILFLNDNMLDITSIIANNDSVAYLCYVRECIYFLVYNYSPLEYKGGLYVEKYFGAPLFKIKAKARSKDNNFRVPIAIEGSTIIIGDVFQRSTVSDKQYTAKLKNIVFSIKYLKNDWLFTINNLIKIINFYNFLHENYCFSNEELGIDNVCLTLLVNRVIIDINESSLGDKEKEELTIIIKMALENENIDSSLPNIMKRKK